ncbi:MAG: nucleotide exchange factor GrpE [Candidatus Cloacimonadales bacterium]
MSKDFVEEKDKLKAASQENKSAEEQAEAAAEAEVEEPQELTLEEKYELLQQENFQLKEKYLRKVAEFENYRRRTIADKSNWIKNATERLVLEVCDVVDNFERALHPDLKKSDPKSFKKGIELIYQQLENILNKEGVKKIASEKTEFDPNLHEAIAHIPSDLEENKVVAVIQTGYKMNDKVIRPARVAVSNGAKPATEKENKKKK